MNVFTEGKHPGEFVLSEASGSRSRDNLKIAASQTVLVGALLAMAAVVASASVSTDVEAGNTGDGILTMADPAINSRAKDGRYVLECISAAANAGDFRIEDPGGKEIGTATVGVAFNKEIKFTIADGAADFVVGDKLYVDIVLEPSDFQFSVIDPAADDGSEIAAALALYPATTGVAETADIAGITRDAEVNGNCLSWPDGITADQKAAAINDLRERGIVVRGG